MTTIAPRGRPRSADADRTIAEATLRLLQELGYGDITMAGVAERAGVSTATLYRRFTSKEDLVVGALTRLVDPRPIDTGSLEADLRETLGSMVTTLSGETGRLLRGLSGETARHPALKAAVRARLVDPFSDMILQMLDRAVRRGEVPAPDDPGLAVSIIVGPLIYRRVITDEPAVQREVDALVPMILRALAAHHT